MKGKTKPKDSMETALNRIMQRSKDNQNVEFRWLMPHYNPWYLYECFNKLDGKKAVGIDGVTKDDYKENIGVNLKTLVSKMKRMAYRPQPVKEVLIPKEGQKGKTRPLGISVFEDKIVQLLTSKILEAIYEPVFRECSYGFRPNRNCHSVIKKVIDRLYVNRYAVVIDVDIKNFFGTINHQKLVELLRIKIKDDTFIRYIVRMLKAGVLCDGELRKSEEGSPQGNVASPILANIYAHYAIDVWFEDVVKEYTKGNVELYRYCDDLLICCEEDTDAERIKRALIGRLYKYGLELNQEKTRMVRIDKRSGNRKTFDFLGFTFYLGKSRKGVVVPKVRTSKKRLRMKLKRVNEWCKKYRCSIKLRQLWQIFRSKVRGHMQYYSVSTNLFRVKQFVKQAVKIFFKWMNRRSQKRSLSWDKFNKFLIKYPLPKIRVYVKLF